MTSNDIPDEFPKKKQEDRVCQYQRTCTITACLGNSPHIEIHECGLGHQPINISHKKPCTRSKPCIPIPNVWPDKGFPKEDDNCDCESCHRAEQLRLKASGFA